MGCLSLSGHGPISDEAFTYMHWACELARQASYLESLWIEAWVVIAIGVAPFLFAFLRGKGGYPTLAVIAAVAIYSSFSMIGGTQDMRSQIERVEAQLTHKPADARKLAESSGIVHILNSVDENRSRIKKIKFWMFVLEYISGCLVVIAGWSSASIMSRRIKWPQKK